MPCDTRKAFKFGPFGLEINDHLLLRNDKVISLDLRAFEVLVCHRRGHLLEKEELMREVWAESFDEEANIADFKDDYPIGRRLRGTVVIVFRRLVSQNGKARKGY